MAAAVETQPRNLPLFATPELCSGGTFIVTGANTGLGYEAAKHLVELGSAKVVLGVRTPSAGEEAKALIEEATRKTNIVEAWQLDLSSYDSVKAFAKKAETDLDRIDGLIENAGVAASQRSLVEGHLVTVTVNVLSTILLGVLLLPKLRESARKFGNLPHLVFVTSRVGFDSVDLYNQVKDDFIVKMDDEKMPTLKMYPLSKLMETMAVRHLATLVPVSRTGVVINLVCPGLCKTSLNRNAPPAFRENLNKRKEQFGRTAEDGSRTLLHGVVAGKTSHGCFLDSCRIAEDVVPYWATSEEGKKSSQHIWEAVANELEAAAPGSVQKILQL